MDAVLVDSGVWYALFDPRDPHRGRCDDKLAVIELLPVIVPWPTLYETLGTRFVNNAAAMEEIEQLLKSPGVSLLDDAAYRLSALEAAFEFSLRGKRPMSLVDWVIRHILEDTTVEITHLATFNIKDFYDVCERRRIEII